LPEWEVTDDDYELLSEEDLEELFNQKENAPHEKKQNPHK